MIQKLLSILVLTILFTTNTTPVLAGGQMVSVYADTEGATNNNGLHLRVIRAYLNPTIPCKGTTLTFYLSPSQDGDYITTSSGTSTYTMSEDRKDSGCNTYAKMGSMVKGVRQVTVDARNGDTRYTGTAITVDFDGEYHADNETNGYMYRSSIVDPYASNPYWKTALTPTAYPVPVGTLTVNVLSQEIAPMHNRKVVIKWNAIESSQAESSVFYDIYGKPEEGQWHRILSSQAGPSATLTLGRDDYSIRVQGCIRKVGNCIDSNTLFLPKIQEENGAVITTKPIESISSTPTTGDNNETVDELNQKIASLEGKLAESDKKQNALQQTVNNLLSWIKSRFWFFK